MGQKTLILGASDNPSRAAYTAAEMLHERSMNYEAVGMRPSEVFGVKIQNIRDKPLISDIDTITLYIGPDNQEEWYDYIIGLKPRRIIFNPGTYNLHLWELAKKHGIVVESACTLVLLSTGQYMHE